MTNTDFDVWVAASPNGHDLAKIEYNTPWGIRESYYHCKNCGREEKFGLLFSFGTPCPANQLNLPQSRGGGRLG